jgi:hypothetical protein
MGSYAFLSSSLPLSVSRVITIPTHTLQILLYFWSIRIHSLSRFMIQDRRCPSTVTSHVPRVEILSRLAPEESKLVVWVCGAARVISSTAEDDAKS